MTLFLLIKRWYQGRYIPPDNFPDSDLIIVMGHYERHWTAIMAGAVIEFYLRHWKWLWTTAVALIALSFTAFSLK